MSEIFCLAGVNVYALPSKKVNFSKITIKNNSWDICSVSGLIYKKTSECVGIVINQNHSVLLLNL